MKKVIALIMLVSQVNFLAATTIVIYISPDFVIMAADSKAVYTNAKTYKETTSTVSKIYKTGNVYFSIAGLVSNNVRSFNVAQIADAGFKSSANVSVAIDTIKSRLKRALLAYLINQKKSNYALYKRNIEADKYLTSIGVITIFNKRPYAHIIGFEVIDGGTIQIKIDEDYFAANAQKDAVYYLGTSAEINRYMNTIQKSSLSPVTFVDKLMNLQINKTPELVSAPVDIIKITPKEAVWVRRKKTTPIEL